MTIYFLYKPTRFEHVYPCLTAYFVIMGSVIFIISNALRFRTDVRLKLIENYEGHIIGMIAAFFLLIANAMLYLSFVNNEKMVQLNSRGFPFEWLTALKESHFWKAGSLSGIGGILLILGGIFLLMSTIATLVLGEANRVPPFDYIFIYSPIILSGILFTVGNMIVYRDLNGTFKWRFRRQLIWMVNILFIMGSVIYLITCGLETVPLDSLRHFVGPCGYIITSVLFIIGGYVLLVDTANTC